MDKIEIGEVNDLEDILKLNDIKNGRINIIGSISPFEASDWLSSIYKAVEFGNKVITIRIISPGGEVYPSFAIYDNLRLISKKGIKIEAIVEGFAASAAAAIVLQAADVRKCLPSSRFLLHEVSRWAFGSEKASDLKDEAKEIEILTNMIINILSERSGKSVSDVKNLVERKEIWFSAQEALDWGLIDEIIR